MGEVYGLVNKAKEKFPGSNIGATFLDPNSWIRDGDFGRDGLHLNRCGASQLGYLYSRVCELGSEC
jgi:hypothetical protein